jgi:hypothetical protein
MSSSEARRLAVVDPPSGGETVGAEAAHAAIISALAGLRFGSVEVVVHDGRVVQIIRTEKLRLER